MPCLATWKLKEGSGCSTSRSAGGFRGLATRGNRHCLLDALTTDRHFGTWLDRITALPDYLIERLCNDAVGLGITPEEATVAVDFLKYRRDSLRGIIDRNRREFRGITQWSLFP